MAGSRLTALISGVDEAWKPWDHAEKLEGGKHWQCSHCCQRYAGTATRLTQHLAGLPGQISACRSVPPEIKLSAQTALHETTTKKKRQRLAEELGAATTSTAGSSDGERSAAASSAALQGTLHQAFDRADKASLHAAIAQLVYSEGLPFTLVESPAFKAVLQAAQQLKGRANPPTRKQMAGPLLQQAYQSLEQQLEPYMCD